MKTPRVRVDFNEYDRVSKEIPIPRGSLETIERTGTAIRPGLLLQLYSADLDDDGKPADLVVDGRIRFDPDVGLWLACVNPATFRHVAQRTQVEQLDR